MRGEDKHGGGQAGRVKGEGLPPWCSFPHHSSRGINLR